MRLKSLELVGFKSFTERTVINFSKGVTAIVGPNGAGKSNIVDAIRWVMGETAPTFIRTKLLEDVIFSGSEGASPLGMAEVSLIFDNSEGPKPVGYESFSEIQVTRKAFRDGESEFFINRAPCRLKDIVELFLDTGSGARGYCIIEQAKVQQIISAKSIEKRMLIDEAAGVAKYRLRKREAVRKLESTGHNLSRVSDILLEVKRQLGSIDRQARKAERFKKLKHRLNEVEVELLRRRIAGESTRESRISESVESLKSELSLIDEKLQVIKSREQKGRNQIFTTETELESLREEHSGTNEAFFRLDTELEGIERELSRLFDKEEELLGEIEQLKVEVGELEKRSAGRKEDLEEIGHKLAGYDISEADPGRGYELMNGELAGKKELYESRREELVGLLSEISGYENAGKIQEKWYGETERKKSHLLRESDRVRAELEETEERLGKEVEKDRRKSLEVGRVEENISGVKGKNSEHEREVKRLEERLLSLYRDREMAQSRLGALKQLLDEYELFGESVSFTMRGVEEGKENIDVIGVLGELIDVEKGYERAVEAALGESLKYIVVKDPDDGVVALKALKDADKGRASFAPVKIRRRGSREVEVPRGEGVISLISGIISTPGECRELVEDLLGDVLLVNSVDDAIRLWKTNGFWATYVTLDGDVVHPSGVLTGGSSLEEGSGVLVRKREMADLENRLIELDKNVSITEKKIQNHRDHLARGVKAREELTEKLTTLQKENHSIRINMEYLEREVEKGKKRVKWGEEEESHLQAEMKRFEEQRVERNSKLNASRERVRILEGELEELKGEISHLEENLQDLQEERGRRSIEIVEYQERRHALESELESIFNLISDKRGYLTRAEEDIESLVKMREELGESKSSMREELKGIAGKRDSLEGRIMKEVKEIDRLKENLESLHRESISLMDDIDRKREELSSAREELASIRTRFENFTSIARESYGIEDLDDIPASDAHMSLSEEELDGEARETRRKVESIGEVNIEAIEERDELAKRFEELSSQKVDLEASMSDLMKVISKIDRESRDKFQSMFDRVNEKFSELFPKLFMGGKGELVLSEEGDPLDAGIEIIPQPPGKRLKNLSLLSNGEKALTGICLLLSLFFERPGPFLFLDEVDAPLDEANVDRFNRMVREISHSRQIILITHKKRSMELADQLYGVTMDRPGISRVVSAQLS